MVLSRDYGKNRGGGGGCRNEEMVLIGCRGSGLTSFHVTL